MREEHKIEELVGQIIKQIDGDKNSEELIFHLEDGRKFKMTHNQDCCENVTIEDIEGNLEDLLNSPITQAEESTYSDKTEDSESFTWTFYKLATIKGYITIRWLGESNGYYSESIDFELVA